MRALRLIAALLFCAFATSSQAVSLWLANDSEVERVELDGAPADLRLPIPHTIRLAATRDGGAYLLTNEGLVRIASDGRTAWISDIGARGHGQPLSLAVDPSDDTAWIVTDGNILAHVGTDGELVTGATLLGKPRALAVAPDRSVWVAGELALWHFSPAAQMTRSIDFDAPARIDALHVDAVRDRAWLVTGHDATLLDIETGTAIVALTFERPAVTSAFDAQAGLLWLLTTETLVAYDAEGLIVHSMALGSLGLNDARALAVDPGTGATAIATSDRLASFDSSGHLHMRGHSLGRDLSIAGRPPYFELWLTVRGWSDTASASDGLPFFYGDINATCNGVRCALPHEYWDRVRPIASLDGISIAGRLEVGEASQRYRFAASAPVDAGTHRFSARVIDRFGQQSNQANLTFDTVDSRRPQAVDASPGANQIAPKAPNQPPAVSITAPINGAIFSAGSNITLTATASDPDGSISKVEFYRGGNTSIGTASTSPYTIVWSNVAAASYTITAKAYDNKNATTTSSQVTINVTGNLPPIVSLTAPTTGSAFAAGAAITLSATASDPDGSIARVEFYDGTALLGFGSSAPFSFTWTTAGAGNHALTAKAIDNAGATAQSTVADIVVAQPPLIVVTEPASCSIVDAPPTLVLTADAVSPGASITSVEFFDGGSPVGTVTRAPYRYASSNVSIGTHSITARATDSRGFVSLSRPSLVTVRAGNQAPTVTITSPSDGASFGPSAAIPISANASDSDGAIAFVAFYVNSSGNVSLLRMLSSPPFSFLQSGLGAGSYALTAVARDDRSAETTSAPVHFVVTSNAPPSVNLTAPIAGSSYVAPATINLAASASDADGSIAKVEFFAGTALLGSATVPPYSATWTNVPAGSYSLTARATDNAGATATSAPVGIAVTANASPTVAVTSPANGNSYFAPANISIVANAADPDGAVARVDFYANGASIGAITASPYSLLWSGIAAGTYAITAIATDDRGAQTTSSAVSVTVLAGPTLTIASGLDGSTVNDDSVRITGRINAPNNSAVNVNGRVALLDAAGNFALNSMGLVDGTNAIAVTVTSQGGQSSTQTINITRSGKSPFQVMVDPDEGFAPLTTKFTVTNRGNVAFGSVEFDFDDNGTTDFVAVPAYFNNGVLLVQTIYAAGTWTAVVRVKDTNGIVIHSSKFTVVALSPGLYESMLRGVYTDMLDRLRAGDIAGALTAVTDSVYDKYSAVFQTLQPNLRTIVEQLGSVEDVTFGMDLAEYSIVRDTADGPQRFMIYLIRGADGIWRIEGM